VRLNRAIPMLLSATLLIAACGGSAGPVIDPGDGGNYTFTLTPADFVTGIDNPYLPLTVGSRWVFEGGGERTEIEVLAETRVVMGITATVVRDTVSEDGELIEDTFDWFAQDVDGNVWYLGEDSTEYANGEPTSTAGSWEAGVDGALPGIVMLADPTAGRAYRQEYYVGEAEDMAQVDRIGQTVSVPFGDYEDVIVITEWTPLSPDTVEEKYYAPGIGMIKEAGVQGGSGGAELIEYTPGG
jgi:hypothetical protein